MHPRSWLLQPTSSLLEMHFRNWDILQDGALRWISWSQPRDQRREKTRRQNREKRRAPRSHYRPLESACKLKQFGRRRERTDYRATLDKRSSTLFYIQNLCIKCSICYMVYIKLKWTGKWIWIAMNCCLMHHCRYHLQLEWLIFGQCWHWY